MCYYATPREQWIADEIAKTERQDRAQAYVNRKRREKQLRRRVNMYCSALTILGAASIIAQVM